MMPHLSCALHRTMVRGIARSESRSGLIVASMVPFNYEAVCHSVGAYVIDQTHVNGLKSL